MRREKEMRNAQQITAVSLYIFFVLLLQERTTISPAAVANVQLQRVSYWRELGWANGQCAHQRRQDRWFPLPSSVYVKNNHSLPSNILSIKQNGSSPVPQQTENSVATTGAWTESAHSPFPPHSPQLFMETAHGVQFRMLRQVYSSAAQMTPKFYWHIGNTCRFDKNMMFFFFILYIIYTFLASNV